VRLRVVIVIIKLFGRYTYRCYTYKSLYLYTLISRYTYIHLQVVTLIVVTLIVVTLIDVLSIFLKSCLVELFQ